MQSLTGWYQNLKKWQKGGLIGCAVGILFAVIIILSPTEDSLGEWITDFHEVFFLTIHILLYLVDPAEQLSGSVGAYGGSLAIVILYGGLGALWGRIQQGTSTFWKWSLTALLAFFLLLFYVLHTL